VRVEILESDKRIYSDLIDDGSEVMRFKSGLGFITKSQCLTNGWAIQKKLK